MKRLLLALPLALTTCTSSMAVAQESRCYPREKVVQTLTERHNETIQSFGTFDFQGEIRLLETWANEDTGSWSIVITTPKGTSCVPIFGGDFVEGNPLSVEEEEG